MSGKEIALFGAAGAAVVAAGSYVIVGMVRKNPEKRERKRRRLIHEQGRLGEALILEFADNTIYYSYSVGGVQYEASQDVSLLLDCLPADADRLVGPARLKYISNSPANSILVCEEWSGLRAPQRIQ